MRFYRTEERGVSTGQAGQAVLWCIQGRGLGDASTDSVLSGELFQIAQEKLRDFVLVHSLGLALSSTRALSVVFKIWHLNC